MPGRLPDVLREREYRLLFSGYASSLLGDGMVNVALAFAVLELGGSPSELGIVLAGRTLALVVCLLAGGVVADRISRRAVMVAADVTRLISQGLLAALLISGTPQIFTVVVLTAVTGAATGFLQPREHRAAAAPGQARAAAAGQRAQGHRSGGRGDPRAAARGPAGGSRRARVGRSRSTPRRSRSAPPSSRG